MEQKELSEIEKAKSDALKFLSARSRSTAELEKKLKRKRYSAMAIEETVAVLKRQGFLDDEKFAKLFANSLTYSRPTGKSKLKFDLKQKGVPADVIERTLGNLQDYDEAKMAEELVRKRLRLMSGVPEEAKKRRLFGFLQRRGFASDVIFKALDRVSFPRKRESESDPRLRGDDAEFE